MDKDVLHLLLHGGRRKEDGQWKEGVGNEKKNKEQTLPLVQRGGVDVSKLNMIIEENKR